MRLCSSHASGAKPINIWEETRSPYRLTTRAQKQLKLLLDLTNRVMTKLELRNLLHKIAVSIRHVMQCDSVGVALPEAESGELRLYILDFPAHGKSIESGAVSDTTERLFRTGETINLADEQIPADRRLASRGYKSEVS